MNIKWKLRIQAEFSVPPLTCRNNRSLSPRPGAPPRQATVRKQPENRTPAPSSPVGRRGGAGPHRAKGARGAGKSAGGMHVAMRPRGRETRRGSFPARVSRTADGRNGRPPPRPAPRAQPRSGQPTRRLSHRGRTLEGLVYDSGKEAEKKRWGTTNGAPVFRDPAVCAVDGRLLPLPARTMAEVGTPTGGGTRSRARRGTRMRVVPRGRRRRNHNRTRRRRRRRRVDNRRRGGRHVGDHRGGRGRVHHRRGRRRRLRNCSGDRCDGGQADESRDDVRAMTGFGPGGGPKDKRRDGGGGSELRDLVEVLLHSLVPFWVGCPFLSYGNIVAHSESEFNS